MRFDCDTLDVLILLFFRMNDVIFGNRRQFGFVENIGSIKVEQILGCLNCKIKNHFSLIMNKKE